MTEAEMVRTQGRTAVSFRLSKNSELDGVVGNLAAYGFVRSEEALRYALTHTQDTVPGLPDAIRVGKTGTIDRAGWYRISEGMSTCQIADILLNHPNYYDGADPYGYLFMP